MNRTCGDCQLCCKLLPVQDAPLLQKKAGERCKHQAHHIGCRVYNTGAMPPSCRLWNCAWLVDDDTADLSRPDRSRYVIDILPDFVTLQPHDGGAPTEIPVLQVWIDPKHPDAHRDPALRAMLDRRHVAALIRYDQSRALLVSPPSVSGGTWYEIASNQSTAPQHSAGEVFDVLMKNGIPA